MNNKIKEIEQLQRRISDLETALNFSDDGLHLLDENGITIFINNFCSVHEGLVYDEIKGKSMQELQKEGVISDSVTVKVLETHKTVTILQHVKSGRDMLVTGIPIFDEGGKIHRVMVCSRDITELNRLKKKLMETQALYAETRNRLNELDGRRQLPSDIICRSGLMRKVVKTAATVAKVDSNILITGDSGTGKGVISRFIHDQSKRNGKPFVKIDCSSIPESLFESEVFGYESGAFTGANSKGKIGLMELADGGTLFLDEIGELPLGSQAKLLRAIQDREIVRIGGSKVRKIDVRIISATNRDLEKMIEENNFREDLYYRINVIPIRMPSLKERPEDIPELIHSFVQRLCKKYEFNRRFNMDAIEVLMEHEWKGNIRELENIVEMTLITSEKELIGVDDLPPSVMQKASLNSFIDLEGLSFAQRVGEFEKKMIESLLKRGLTPVEIAKELRVDVTTIRRKMSRYGLIYRKKAVK